MPVEPAQNKGEFPSSSSDGEARGRLTALSLARRPELVFMALLATIMFGLGLAAGSAQPFKVGDLVQCNSVSDLRVRESAGVRATELGKQKPGASGKILEGPLTADGHVWWKVGWADGAQGWSANYLAAAPQSPPPTPPSQPSTQSAPSPVPQTMVCEDKGLRDYLGYLVPTFNKAIADLRAENEKLRKDIRDLKPSLAKNKPENGGASGGAGFRLGLLALALAALAVWRSWQQQPAMLQATRLEEELRTLKRIVSSLSANAVRPIPEPARSEVRSTSSPKPREPQTGGGLSREKPGPKPSESTLATGVSPAAAMTVRSSVKPVVPGELRSQPDANQLPATSTAAPKSPAATVEPVVVQPQAPAAAQPGLPLTPSPAEEPPQPAANVAPPELGVLPREALGRAYTVLCHKGLASYLDDLLPSLNSALPGAVVRAAYHPTKAQELYFADSVESSSLWYWRVTYGNQHYLLPRPESMKSFGGTAGFCTPSRDVCSPEKLELCVPALLEERGKRWEVTNSGTLA